jgi:hypothetical protein
MGNVDWILYIFEEAILFKVSSGGYSVPTQSWLSTLYRDPFSIQVPELNIGFKTANGVSRCNLLNPIAKISKLVWQTSTHYNVQYSELGNKTQLHFLNDQSCINIRAEITPFSWLSVILMYTVLVMLARGYGLDIS